MEKYTPKIHPMRGKGRYIEFLLEGRECHLCNAIMLKKTKPEHSYDGLFPNYVRINQEAQMKAAGITFQSSVKVDDEPICKECAEAGKADFLCAMCEQRKPTSKINESYGDPAEYLCKDCYETVPAKVWDEKLDQLSEAHRYDFD